MNCLFCCKSKTKDGQRYMPSTTAQSTQDQSSRQVVGDGGTVNQNSSNLGNGLAIFGQAQIHGSMNCQMVQNQIVYHQNPGGQPATLRDKWSSLITFYSSQDAWLFPIPGDETIRFKPEKYFVQMAMDILDRSDQRLVESKFCLLSELFDPLVGEERPMRILITANGGFGKSTLCTKLAYDWSKGIQTFSCFPCQSTLVLKYRLRDLKEGQNLENELVKFLHYYAHRKGTPLSKTEDIVEEYGNRLLLIMDGLDEVLVTDQRQVEMILQSSDQNHQSIFRLSTVIVTSRPCPMEFSFLTLFENHFRITGLTQESRIELIKTYFGKDTEKMCKLEDMFHDAVSFDITFSALYTILICYSLSQKLDKINQRKTAWFTLSRVDKSIPNQKELISDCALLMVKRSNVRNDFHFTDCQIEQMLSTLGRMFLKQEYANVNAVSSCSANVELGEFFECVLQSGILKTVHSENSDEEMLEAIHNTFRACLAGSYAEKAWSALPTDIDRRNYLKRHIPLKAFRVNIYIKPKKVTFGGYALNDMLYTFKHDNDFQKKNSTFVMLVTSLITNASSASETK